MADAPQSGITMGGRKNPERQAERRARIRARELHVAATAVLCQSMIEGRAIVGSDVDVLLRAAPNRKLRRRLERQPHAPPTMPLDVTPAALAQLEEMRAAGQTITSIVGSKAKRFPIRKPRSGPRPQTVERNKRLAEHAAQHLFDPPPPAGDK
jgi:D-serine deaminase-like pyridoxal phosphate-dependent protein